MITFHYVKYKNILSSGDNWTQIDLDRNKSTLVVGENGAGKSTLLDALSFGLYGKPFRRINKPQLVNSINKKGLEVHISFTANKTKYLIKRGIKPNIFEIWRGETLLNQDAASKDYQSYLEDNILKMNFKSFGQIVVLGSSTFVPFMQLPAAQRRDVIEDLLDIQIFTSMNSLLKEKISANKDEIQEIKYDISLLKNKIESAKEHNESIREMKQSEVKKIKAKVKEYLYQIEEYDTAINEFEQTVSEKYESISHKDRLLAKQKELNGIRNKLESKINRLKKDNKFFNEHDECPSCFQEIDIDFKSDIMKENIIKTERVNKALDDLAIHEKAIEDKLKTIYDTETEITKINVKIQENRASKNIVKNALKGIKEELESAEQEVEKIDTQKIKDLEEELKTYHIKEEQLIRDKEVLGVLASMLKDGGIKTLIIRQYVPIMNKLINKYLSAMDFFVDFQLDESFNETIKSRFRDAFSYSSFSEGEKLRIDLALLFTWRAISKMRNSMTTNILIMDEIMDSSLDNAGTEEFLKIINELTADSNVFIISHKGDQLFDKFEHTLKFKKVKNFSVLST